MVTGWWSHYRTALSSHLLIPFYLNIPAALSDLNIDLILPWHTGWKNAIDKKAAYGKAPTVSYRAGLMNPHGQNQSTLEPERVHTAYIQKLLGKRNNMAS